MELLHIFFDISLILFDFLSISQYNIMEILNKGGIKLSTLCERLKEKREKLGLTQSEVAKKLGITQSTYAGYETEKSSPDLKMIAKIADIYDTTVDYLIGRISYNQI